MLNASSRLIRAQLPSFFLSSSSLSFPSQIGRRSTGGIRFHGQPAAAATPENVGKMDNTDKNNPKTKEEEEGDVMVGSFGVDYATRSIEEGFGGVYEGKQSLDDQDDDIEIVHGNPPPEYDKSQGNEVTEEEKSPHQS